MSSPARPAPGLRGLSPSHPRPRVRDRTPPAAPGSCLRPAGGLRQCRQARPTRSLTARRTTMRTHAACLAAAALLGLGLTARAADKVEEGKPAPDVVLPAT